MRIFTRTSSKIRKWVTASVVVAPCIMLGLAGCSNVELKGAEADIKTTDIRLDLPPVPDFDVPSESNPHTVRELRLVGGKQLNTEVQVKGYITWIYDCFVSGGPGGPVGTPDMDPKEEAKVRKRIMEGKERCYKPHLIMNDQPDAPGDLGVQVVEIQRELRQDEKKHMPKEELAALPPVPQYEVGDEVIMTGQFVQRSPKGFANTGGLLVYKSLEHVGAPPPVE